MQLNTPPVYPRSKEILPRIPPSVKRMDKKELEVALVTLQDAYDQLREMYNARLQKNGQSELIIY